MSSNPLHIPDAEVRRQAETTFDRNIVVVAGAGTGKTTLLANRLIHALIREPGPIEVTQVVALTFTNKAAAEMKARLRERLLSLLSPDHSRSPDAGAVRTCDLRDAYGLSSGEIGRRAETALRDLEKAQIGTLHSFAAHLLRLYPIESGVDPDFEEDDGLRFDEHFSTQWDIWLDEELGPKGSNHPHWRRLLAAVGLAEMRKLASALCSELVPLDEIQQQSQDPTLSPAIRDWFVAKRDRAAQLLTAYDRQKRRKAELSMAAVHDLLGVLVECGIEEVQKLDAARLNIFARDLGNCPAGWGEDDFAACANLVRIAKRVLAVDRAVIGDLLALLIPFARKIRAGFLAQGCISFDGLLARARSLLRDHPKIRERLKREYHAILVDEFQDTDPSQYEILLYLAEQPGRCAFHWRDVRLTPGKLFIVGDPKQSIYAFRRADIEAFEQVVKKIRSSGGIQYDLTTNFRSHERVLKVVNACFDRLLRPVDNVQPPNVGLVAQPNRHGGAGSPGVILRMVTSAVDEEEFDAAAATRIEAEYLAAWIKEELLAGETLTESHGRCTPLRPGHIALLFRKLTQAQDYLEALRRHGLPYVTDGEKHFYRRQEIVDLVNLLRVIENPHDAIALVGVLRSPIGGLTDREVYELRERAAFDYRRADALAGWSSPRASAVRRLYERLAELFHAAPLCTLSAFIELVFSRLPLLELAAASLHGEQAVANLIKVRDMSSVLADRPSLTLHGFVELMIQRLEEQPDEAESALAEESFDALRILTIHKAKGLEFPVVVLPGLHHGPTGGMEEPVISHDWASGVFGISLGGRLNLGAVLVGEKSRVREEAEGRRLFYVGMTRAKERIILSGGLTARAGRGTFVALLKEASDPLLGTPASNDIQIGAITITQTVLTVPDQLSRSRQEELNALLPPPDRSDLVRRWEQRTRVWHELCESPSRLTPTQLAKHQRLAPGSGRYVRADTERSRVLGIVAHRLLEEWNFAENPRMLMERIQPLCRTLVPVTLTDDVPGMIAEIEEIFDAFIGSKPYQDLARADILGRELPFVIPWNPQSSDLSPLPCILEGVIDVVYRLDGQVWVTDYKTDRVEAETLERRAAEYAIQARAYRVAVAQSLGLDHVMFKLVFLRSGTAFPITGGCDENRHGLGHDGTAARSVRDADSI
ncbi:MAG TPA: UvrD-helicase domain-containing protein [Nitrospiraceae bacterium]|nr:UvrD-helicase domain-containing protein [Nitrospiraceae bacterium]